LPEQPGSYIDIAKVNRSVGVDGIACQPQQVEQGKGQQQDPARGSEVVESNAFSFMGQKSKISGGFAMGQGRELFLPFGLPCLFIPLRNHIK
jgi:hypothetical protein